MLAHCLEQPTRTASLTSLPRRYRFRERSALPPLFGLAPGGVYPAASVAGNAVRSYRTFSPLPESVRTRAVYFLWHFPSNGLESALPDVIRHTALWSSDFPLSASPPFPVKTRKATVRSSCQLDHYSSCFSSDLVGATTIRGLVAESHADKIPRGAVPRHR
jgi:hypothetical protein